LVNRHFIRELKSVQYQNEKAFTLLEVLFALTIFSTIVFFIAPLLQVIADTKDTNGRLQEMEWEVFCSQVKKEIHISSKVEVISGRLMLTNNNETINYEKYGSNIRRRVNSTGHETLLQNVAAVTFTRIGNSVEIIVVDVWGKEYSVVVHSYIRWVSAI
jgi:competence protein ComGF